MCVGRVKAVKRLFARLAGQPAELQSAIIRRTDADGQGSDGQSLVWHDPAMLTGVTALLALMCDALQWLRLTVRSSRSIKAENLFLRRQLALYIERGIRPRRIDPVTRVRLALLSRIFDWRDALVIVRPETLLRWHRSAWRLLWRLKSRPGRPAIPAELQRLIRQNVTAHPTAAWTLQQLREVVGPDHRYQLLLHDRDSIFSHELDQSFRALGIRVLRSARHCPKMNAICERVIGTLRRECLGWLVPLSESHLRTVLRSWVKHYNRGRPHMALGPGIPDPPPAAITKSSSRHRRAESYSVQARPTLGGLHHEYHLIPA